MNLKIEDFKRMENLFTFSDETEKNHFTRIKKTFKSKIKKIEGKEDFIRLLTDVSKAIKNLAKKDGISDLIITSKNEELKPILQTFSSNKKSLKKLMNFSTEQLNQMKKMYKPAPLGWWTTPPK